MQNATLVYGANGAQGRAVIDKLVKRGHTPVALVKDEEKGEQLVRRGIRVVVADLNDLSALQRASEGMSNVFLTLPLGLDAATVKRLGEHAVDAAKGAGVEKIVFNTGTRIPLEQTSINAFEEKRYVEAYLAQSGVPFVSLRPTFYYGNFLGPWTKLGIIDDAVIAYPIPAQLKAAWLSWEDAARYAVRALEQDELNGHCIDIGGPETISGEDIAERFSSALGRDAKYVMVPHDAFEQGLAQALGAETGRAITDMYRWLVGREDTELFAVDLHHLKTAFGFAPTPLEPWVREQNWSGGAK